MYAIIGIIGMVFAAAVVEVACGIAAVPAVRDGLDRIFWRQGYLRFFLGTALLAAALYALGIAVMGPFLGVYEAAIQVGTLCVFTAFFGAMFFCFGDVARDTSFFSVVMVTAVWGCAILLSFYDHAASGALLSIKIG